MDFKKCASECAKSVWIKEKMTKQKQQNKNNSGFDIQKSGEMFLGYFVFDVPIVCYIPWKRPYKILSNWVKRCFFGLYKWVALWFAPWNSLARCEHAVHGGFNSCPGPICLSCKIP